MIRLKSLHHVRFSVTDLQAAESFAVDFGLVRAAEENGWLYMRGAGADAYHYVARQGETNCLLSIGLLAESRADLEEAVRVHGATPIRELEGPGGGWATTVVDPEGVPFDLVAGVAARTPDPLRPSLHFNFGVEKPRRGAPQALPPDGPPQIMRLGHIGLYVKSFKACAPWYQEVLGLLPSDLAYMGHPDNLITGFFRLNRGAEFVDHHTLFLAEYGKTDLHHVSFEVQDFEAQFMAHKWLLGKGREPVWGVGRHPLGCHIFDVWMAPSGYRFESFTDTDVLTADRKPGVHDIGTMSMDMWSSDPPDRYFGPMPEELVERIKKQHAGA